MKKTNKFLSMTMVLLLMITMIGPTVSMAAETTVDLGTAESFAILAGSTITNTGTTIIDGDVGLHPGLEFTGQGTAIISGKVHLANAVALQAKTDLLTAYNDAAGRAINNIGSELGGWILEPGVYSNASSFQITGTLTLDGKNDPDSVFIFQTGSTLTTASGSKVELINGANYDNVFWQVGSSATLGTNSDFAGNILSSLSITATSGARIMGKLLALGAAVTLDNNTIANSTTSSLTVIKVVSGDVTGLSLPVFEITVSGPEGFLETENLVHNQSFTWDDLAPGTYTVTESRTNLSIDWTVTGEGAVQVPENISRVVTITNAYNEVVESEPEDTTSDDTTPVETTPVETTPVETNPVEVIPNVQLNGSLTVEKIVTGNVDGMTLPTFEFTITGPESFKVTRNLVNNESYTWVNLVPGVYNVTENRTGLSNEWTVSGEGDVQVIADQNIVATITNNYEAITTNETIPQTGQTSDYGMSAILGITAILFAGVGMFIVNRRKRFNA